MRGGTDHCICVTYPNVMPHIRMCSFLWINHANASINTLYPYSNRQIQDKSRMRTHFVCYAQHMVAHIDHLSVLVNSVG